MADAASSDQQTDTQPELSLYARIYAPTRYTVLLMVAVLVMVSREVYADLILENLAIYGLSVFVVATVGFLIAHQVMRYPLRRVLVWLAFFDLVAIGLLGAAFHRFEDPVYPFLLATPIFYGQLVRRGETWAVAIAAAAVYLASHFPYAHAEALVFVALAVKAGLIVFLGGLSAANSARQQRREIETARATEEEERLNEQLSRRLAELQAVSQITEVIHSSLDFDRVGPLVLEVLTKVLNVSACCLFVIDKRKAETLFSASVGMPRGAVQVDAPFVLDEPVKAPGSHFSCIPVIDHHNMMVVFCAEAEVIDLMESEDQLVLQAVSSELVVAVENSRLYKLTKRLAITDELTGLYNYRYLQQRLDEEIERAKRYHKDLSLLMLDVDDFKLFNDTHGHIAGDHALAELGQVLRDGVREVDVVCRYGGEEFSVVLPETDAAGAYVVGEKLREAIAAHGFSDADGTPGQHLTVSLGLATFPTHAPDKETLLRLADDALYRAKSGGKDRVRSPVPKRSTVPAGPESPEADTGQEG